MKTSVAVIMALLVGLGIGVWIDGEEPVSPAPSRPTTGMIEPAGRQTPSAARANEVTGFPVASTATFRQWLELEDFRYVTVRNTEIEAGEESTLTYEYSSSFDIGFVTARGADEFYLAGVDGDETVIECWTLQPHLGSRTVQWTIGTGPGSVAPSSVGVPTTPTSPQVVTVGGTLTSPTTRTPNPRIHRDTLLRSASVPPVRCMLPDAEGRFLIVLDEGSTLSSLDLVGTAGLQTLKTPAQMPALQEIYALDLFQHPTFGRVLRATDFPQSEVRPFQTAFFIDLDNDGLFETDTVGDPVLLSEQFTHGGELLTW